LTIQICDFSEPGPQSFIDIITEGQGDIGGTMLPAPALTGTSLGHPRGVRY